MNQLILELLTTLRPALKSRRQAEQLLTHYWADKIALVWTTHQVHRAANEIRLVLTETQAREVLRGLHQQHDAQHGLRWADVIEAIQQSGLGRDIRNRELHRFINHDVLAVDPPQKGTT